MIKSNKTYAELNYTLENAGLDYFRSFNWTNIIRPQDFESLDLKMLKAILPSFVNHNQWRQMINGYKHLMYVDLNEKSSFIAYGDKFIDDKRDRINLIYDLFLSKHETKLKISSGWSSSSFEIEKLHENYNQFCDDGTFDCEMLIKFGLDSRTLSFYSIKKGDAFFEKFKSIKRSTGYMEKRKRVAVSFALRALDVEFMRKCLSENLTKGSKSDLIVDLLRIRNRHLSVANYYKNKRPEKDVERSSEIIKSCSAMLYCIADGICAHSAYNWSANLIKEDIPYLMPVIQRNRENCSSLLSSIKSILEK